MAQTMESASLSRRAVLGKASTMAALIGAGAIPSPFAQLAAAAPVDGNRVATNAWPCFRGPNHDGIIAEDLTLLAGGPKRIWEANANPGNASFAVADNRLYTFGSRNNNLVCLNATTGDVIWKRSIDTHFGDSTPSLDQHQVLVLASKENINHLGKKQIATAYCCDARTGTVIWSRDLPASTGDRQYGHAGSVLIWEELVFCNAGGGAALKKESGEIVWAHPGFSGLATPVLFDSSATRKSVAFFGGDRLLARDAQSGTLLWEIPWKTNLAVNACDPVIFDGKIFICSDYGRGRSLYDIKTPEPKLVWEFGAGKGSSFSSGFFHNGNLFCFAENKFMCLDIASGRPRWTSDGASSGLLIGTTLIRLTNKGELSLGTLSATGVGMVTSTDLGMKDPKAVPAYWNGSLYVRSEQGQIACWQVAEAR